METNDRLYKVLRNGRIQEHCNDLVTSKKVAERIAGGWPCDLSIVNCKAKWSARYDGEHIDNWKRETIQ